MPQGRDSEQVSSECVLCVTAELSCSAILLQWRYQARDWEICRIE